MSTIQWDEEAQDFVRGSAPGGAVVPFGIDPSERAVAFQLIPGQVRMNSFVGAFQELLNAGGPQYNWHVYALNIEQDYDEWRRQADIVREFNFRLEPPNPNYHDDDLVQRIIDDLDLQVAHVSGRSPSVNDDADAFQQFIDWVRRRYGSGFVQALDEDGHETTWVGRYGEGVVPAEERVELDSEDEEAPLEALRKPLDRINDFRARRSRR